MKKLRGVCVGSGYFSQFHFEAWGRIEAIEIVGICDLDLDKAQLSSDTFHLGNAYTDVSEMLATENPNFIDIITPPNTHYDICKLAIENGVHVICQKPFGGTYEMAKSIVNLFEGAKVRLMVHENFRFQPWHREIKKLLDQNFIGDKLHTLNFRLRTGDGWQEDAYMNRQPYFRTMPKLFIYETGVHYIDVFRYLGGEITKVYARLKTLNSNIVGEDLAWVNFDYENNAFGLLDANRFNENTSEDPRLTFGEMLIEGNKGSIRLWSDGKITYQLLGEKEKEHAYTFFKNGFAGDCVYGTQKHFVDSLLSNTPFETEGVYYLKNLEIQDAIYASNEKGIPVDIKK